MPINYLAPTVVRNETTRYSFLRDRLLAEIPDLDAETLADTLEGIPDLKEMLAELVRSALEDEALAAGLSTRLSDMKSRLERFEIRAKRKRATRLAGDDRGRDRQLAAPDFTASLRQAAPTLEWSPRDKNPGRLLEAAAVKLDKHHAARRRQGRHRDRGRRLGALRALQLSVRSK